MNEPDVYSRIMAMEAELEELDLIRFAATEGQNLTLEDKRMLARAIRDKRTVAQGYWRSQDVPGEAEASTTPEKQPHTDQEVTALMNTVESRLYTVQEAADLLTKIGRPVTAKVVRDWLREGRLEGGRGRTTSGRGARWLISPRSLRKCLRIGLPDPDTYRNPYSVEAQDDDHLDKLLLDEA